MKFAAMWLSLLLMGSLLAGDTSQESPVRNTLLERAVQRIDTDDWAKSIPQMYAWLSHDTLFFMDDWSRPKAARLNVVTGQKTPLPKLTTFFNAHGGKVNMLHLSPDTKRFLWWTAESEKAPLYGTTFLAEKPVRWKSSESV